MRFESCFHISVTAGNSRRSSSRISGGRLDFSRMENAADGFIRDGLSLNNAVFERHPKLQKSKSGKMTEVFRPRD